MRTPATIFVFTVVGSWRNVNDSGAPKSADDSAALATTWSIGPIASLEPSAMPARLLSTRKSAKNTGAWSSTGRQEAKGLVPCFLYSAMVSRLMASRDAGSFLFLYFFWIAWSSGCTICMPREARICLKNSGIMIVLMTMTRPTIDRIQATPAPSGSPTKTKSLWHRNMIQATTHSRG